MYSQHPPHLRHAQHGSRAAIHPAHDVAIGELGERAAAGLHRGGGLAELARAGGLAPVVEPQEPPATVQEVAVHGAARAARRRQALGRGVPLAGGAARGQEFGQQVLGLEGRVALGTLRLLGLLRVAGRAEDAVVQGARLEHTGEFGCEALFLCMDWV